MSARRYLRFEETDTPGVMHPLTNSTVISRILRTNAQLSARLVNVHYVDNQQQNHSELCCSQG